jgi:uncharacterized membrane protein YhaH (DUF805 family)
MNFSRAIATCFSKYVDFRGVATRPEYWWWALFNVLVGIVTALLDYALDVNFINNLAALALLLPGTAVFVRRLRDAGYAWPWVLIAFVPIVGAVVLLVFVCQPSKLRYSIAAPPFAAAH